MTRTVTVTFSDNSTADVVGVPDGVTPEEVAARAEREHGRTAVSVEKHPPSTLSAVKRKLDVGVDAFGRGVTSLPALAADAVYNSLDPFGIDKKLSGSSVQQKLQEAAPEFFQGKMPFSSYNSQAGTQPETTGEKYLASTVEAISGMGRSLLTSPIKSALIGGLSGVGAEAGGQLTGNSFLGRTAGAIAGMLGGSKVANIATNAVRPQSADLAREAVQGLDAATLEAAQKMQARAKASGVTMDLAQALEAVGAPAANLTTIRDVLANSRYGSNVLSTLENQPKELELLADTTVGGLKGPQWGAGQAANAVQEAATNRIKQAVEGVRGEATVNYGKIGELPEGTREQLLNVIDNLVKRPGTTDALNSAAASLRAKIAQIEGPEAKAVADALEALRTAPRGKAKALAAAEVQRANEALRQASAKPLEALDVSVAIEDAVGPYKGTPLNPTGTRATGQLKKLGSVVRGKLQEVSPEVAKAEAAFAQGMSENVRPLKQSVVGRLATPRNYNPDIEASTAKLEAIFSKGSDAQVAEAARDIPKMFNELRQVDKDAVPAAAKAFLRSRLDKSFGSTPGETIPGAVTSPDAARKLRDNLFASRAQEQGIKDIAVGIAKSYDLDKDQVVKGVSHFMQVTKGLASRPGKVGGLNWADVAKSGGKSTLADVARLYGFLPFERVARKIEDRNLAKTFEEFDRVLTTPEGAELLLKLAQTSNMSDKAALLIAKFGALSAAIPPDSVEVGE